MLMYVKILSTQRVTFDAPIPPLQNFIHPMHDLHYCTLVPILPLSSERTLSADTISSLLVVAWISFSHCVRLTLVFILILCSAFGTDVNVAVVGGEVDKEVACGEETGHNGTL